ncbi:hypothetical protein [Haloarchaeobius litoreus]|uniref:Uncharacterized protein n=1 Tax=Haloarchaeobius litoreus TaxID=755306 RepID=A0ABD6DM12_9EURY|nr:hypothetical protein [Haloarchaeobius litoreus]
MDYVYVEVAVDSVYVAGGVMVAGWARSGSSVGSSNRTASVRTTDVGVVD